MSSRAYRNKVNNSDVEVEPAAPSIEVIHVPSKGDYTDFSKV